MFSFRLSSKRCIVVTKLLCGTFSVREAGEGNKAVEDRRWIRKRKSAETVIKELHR
jgi:hypothetical protein